MGAVQPMIVCKHLPEIFIAGVGAEQRFPFGVDYNFIATRESHNNIRRNGCGI
jgi:hypothetical protein